MRVLDELTYEELVNPDMSAGTTWPTTYAPPEAYATIDGVNKVALADEDYEEVLIYHRYTADELERFEQAEIAEEESALMATVPDAIAELSAMTSDNATDIADLADAIAELSAIVSELMEV